MRPPGTEGMSEEQLAELVTRDAMIGTGAGRRAGAMNGAHDLGGMHGFGPVEPEPNEPVFHHEWERRVFALNAGHRASSARGTSTCRATRAS